MKTLFLAADYQVSLQKCAEYLSSIGSEIISYKWPLKAMDNIDEVSPHLCVINADDFPRLWKTVVQFIRADKKFEKMLIVLACKAELDDSEQDKAKQLGIGLILHSECTASDRKSLYALLANGGFVEEKITQSLSFKHPANYTIITGQILCMFSSVIIFHPDNPLLTFGIRPGTVIKSCTLKVGQAVIEPLLKLVKNDKTEIQFQVL